MATFSSFSSRSLGAALMLLLGLSIANLAITAKVVVGSGSEGEACHAMIDEKKRKRMISNRESARRSRMKRQKHMEDLVNEKSALEAKLRLQNQDYNSLCQRHHVLVSENEVLRTEKMRLDEFLKYLNEILLSYDITETDQSLEMSDRLLNPWQVCGTVHPITASGMFKF